MSISFSKHKKLILTSILILLISSLGIFILGAGEAQAAWGIDAFVRGILIGIGYILAGALWLGGQILNVAAGLVSGLLAYTEFTKAPIVIIGWKIVRDLTNMFFVLILLIIAFATILRIETYGMKALLPKLIIAALLINFSLVLAGPIIDFSQILTQFFINESGGTDFTAKIATALGLPKIASYKERVCAGDWTNCSEGMTLCVQACGMRGGSTGAECIELCEPTHCQCSAWGETIEDYKWPGGVLDVVNTLMGLLMAIVFSIVAIFAFSAFVFFLLVRILTLWFLLILAPIAWLFWILPATREHFTKWWSAFIKWSFFAPAYMFFVYLALKAFPAFLNMSVIDASDTGVKVDTLLPKLLSFKYLLQFLLVLGILLGGLIVAQKMGVYGAQGAMGIAKGIGKGAGRWTGRRGQILATRPIGGRVGAMGDKIRTGLGKVPILRQALRPTRALAEKERADMAETEKKYSGRTSDSLKSQYKAVNARSKAAIAKILADRGDFKKDDKLGFTETDIQDASKLTKRYEQQKSIVKARPDLAPLVKRPEQTDKEAIREAVIKIKPADMGNLQKEALTPEVIEVMGDELTKADGQLRSNHLSKANETNPSVAVEIKQKIIDNPERKPFRQDVEEYLKSDAGKAVFGEPKPRAKKEAPFTAA